MSTLKTLVDFKTIQSSHLYNKKPSTQALYGYPFIFLYTFVIVLGYLDFEAYFKYNEYYYVILGIIFTLNLLTWLSCFWNLNIKGIVKFSKAYDPYKAEYIKIIPKAHNGNGDFCELIKTKLNSDDKLPEVSFVFQKQKFIYNTDKKKFEALSYPCDFGGILEEFQNHKGLDEAQVEKLTSKYSLNNFDIPVPSFQELFKEHAVAPFFVFQIFCVGLWCLDEFWYYSLFTLFMLVAFESTVVYQRVRTLTEFRSLSLKPFDIYVLRSNEWKLVKSDLLVPGDIISVVRSGEESAVPCDVLILSGNCIVNEAMLSGESTPLLKESIRLREGQDELDLNGVDKNHTLHGGTKVLQVTNTEACPFNAPDAGSIGYVLKTGFGTSQGELVRTMVYSTERVSANNLEALLFILFLLIFAIAAAAYVWIEGTKNNLKTRYKLVLDCILIITSVVPPELPMELSLAVNNSLVALAKEYIYCTEPFRIPFAGKVDICCFDKTGTLTSENLVVEGIAGVSKKDLKELIDPKEAPKSTENVLAAAHALAFIEESGIVGDPMEKATLEAISWRFQDDVVHSSNGQDAIKIFRRFQFSSALKRMSTISKIANTPRDQYLIAVKGAPETIQTMLTTVPQGYEEAYKYFSRRGNRVISLAYKNTSLSNISMVEKLPREEAESGLIFAGFLIFHNPLKEDSKESIKMLNESNHRVIMITGDNALTACHVAQEVEITDQQVLIIDAKPDVDNVLTLKSVDETVSVEVDTNNINKIDQSLINKYDFCMTGPAIKILENTELFKQLLNYTWVYARVSPSQKEYILSELKHEGLTTLMCGDGTNDVGALKQAHVGIALLDATVEDLEKIAYKARIERLTKLYEQQKQMAERFNMPTPPPPPMLAQALGLPANQTAARTVNGRPAPQVDALSMSTQLLEELDDEVPTIKFGDASVASPFTSKLATIKSVCSIIRLGRCTLVATIQMYKILALNCLISAYSLSVLYLDGIKYGDYQATLTGFLLAICFMCISKAKPLDTLAKERPQTNIFNPYLIGSVLGQFAIHIVSLIYIVSQAKSIEVQKPVDLEGEYEPTILNSAVFIISLTLQVSTFAVNYQGRPWRESMRENTALFYGLTGCAAVAFACAIELVPELNSFFQLAPLPGDFQLKLIGGLIFDFGMAYLVEMGFKKMFGNNQPHPITQRRKKLAN